MTITDVVKNSEDLTLQVTTRLQAGVERAWQLWADPRQLERWWGPPTYPATFVEHDLRTDGHASYFMTGPEGDQPRGWWRFRQVDESRRIEILDGFADETGAPNDDMPTMEMVVEFVETSPGVTDMTITTTFPSHEAMQQLVEMGMEEGMREALGQIDAILSV